MKKIWLKSTTIVLKNLSTLTLSNYVSYHVLFSLYCKRVMLYKKKMDTGEKRGKH